MKMNRYATGAALLMAAFLSGSATAQFTQPTKEELSMTELPGYPGAPAVVLFHEQVTKDDLHVMQIYNRVKILTEKGKDEANVEISTFRARAETVWDEGTDLTVTDIQGRTIHPDGTIVPFTGKPYVKTIEKNENFTLQARVFSLPDVEVGSIIEYRYSKRYNDGIVISPDWYIQGPLFVKAAHYVWYPTVGGLHDNEGREINSIGWFPVLPEGASLTHRTQPGGGRNGEPQMVYELAVKDIPPAPRAEYMPPIGSFTYRVLFNFTPYRSSDEFWREEGKAWSKRADAFIGPNGDLRSATQSLIAGASTSDEKLRRIYAAVMKIENTDYTRERSQKEDKSAGIRVVSAGDVLKTQRGNSAQITYLFIGMARAAGFKAYAMRVPDRQNTIFVPQWMNLPAQLSNTIAVVNVDGKEVFFGPGERYMPYGKLQWNYTYVLGLRQVDGGGTAIAQTPTLSYQENETDRIANLKMDENGSITGTINLNFSGQEAARWRHNSLTGDEQSVRNGLRHAMEAMLPKTLNVKVLAIDDLEEYDKPLKVTYDVKGKIGTLTGKRMLLPVDLFCVNDHATFTQEKRDVNIYFHFPQTVKDAMRINFPSTLQVEGVPENASLGIKGLSAYDRKADKGATYVTTWRTFAFGGINVPKESYPQLREFYSQFEAKDQESIVLKLPATTASAATPAEPGN